jgi:hypothetical protein
MTYTVLLDSTADLKQCEGEQKAEFIRSILEAMDIHPEFWPPEESILSVETKIKLRALLLEQELIIVESVDGALEIYSARKKIAEWSKPKYVRKIDASQVDPRKKIYLEMRVTCSSVFEEPNGNPDLK